jgi:hypothetical protein
MDISIAHAVRIAYGLGDIDVVCSAVA